jgi:hypothetical protein
MRRLVVLHKYASFKEALESHIPIMSFLNKWMPYDRLAFVDDRWGKVARGNILYWPPFMIEEEGVASLTLL